MNFGFIAGLLTLLVSPLHREAPPLQPLQVNEKGWVIAGAGAPGLAGTQTPVRLAGINVDGYIFEDGRIPPPWFITDKDFADLAQWGANSFRLNMDYRWFLSRDLQQVNPKGWEYVDWVVAEAERHRLYVILDMHIPVGGMQVGGNVTKLWQDANLQRVFIELWQQVAGRYQNSPAIAGYYLIGEPTPRKAAEWQKLAQDTLEAIRQVTPDQVVIVESPNGNADGLGYIKPLKGTNVMYAWQFYEPFAFTHQGASWEEPGALRAENVMYQGNIIEEFKTRGTDEIEAAEAYPVWTQLISAPLTAPAKATYLTLRLKAAAGEGPVSFDDLQVLENGRPMELLNPDFEEGKLVNERRDKLPDYWHASGARKSIRWEKTDSHSGKRCITFLGSKKPAALAQAAGSETGLYPVKKDAVYMVSVWVKGDRQATQEGTGLEIRWASAQGQYWGPEQLEETIVDNVVKWSQANRVPVYVPEFAASAAAPNRSDLMWTRDTLAIFDKYGLSWHLWDWRDVRGEEENINHIMGLYDGPEGADSGRCALDKKLLEVLQAGWRKSR